MLADDDEKSSELVSFGSGYGWGDECMYECFFSYAAGLNPLVGAPPLHQCWSCPATYKCVRLKNSVQQLCQSAWFLHTQNTAYTRAYIL